MNINVEPVSAMLRDAGLDVFHPRDGTWVSRFTIGTRPINVVLTLPSHNEYFVAIAPILSGYLFAPPEQLPPRVTAGLLRLSSAVPFAKIEYLDVVGSRPAYSASSECSTEGVSGRKLVRRMAACAQLVALVHDALPAMQ